MEDRKFGLIIKALEELIPFNKHLGIKVLQLEQDFVRLLLPFHSTLIGNPFIPALHGGVIATLLDTAGGGAALTTLNSLEDRISTVDIRIDYLLPGKPNDLIAEGRVIRSGNRLVVTNMVAYHGSKEYTVADGRGVYNVKRNQEPTSLLN
ncbi:MAG: hotdog fold thioesterase [Bacteroidia bacterium]|nr:hotdog fold thioesterase [Bacteroidia bacterium]MDW8158166.1 hotdog fold thioesterase [Bacteroidia bacterium]